jgi:hypothetical protein
VNDKPTEQDLCAYATGAYEWFVEDNPNATDAEALVAVNAVLVDDCGFAPFAEVSDMLWAVKQYYADIIPRSAAMLTQQGVIAKRTN